MDSRPVFARTLRPVDSDLHIALGDAAAAGVLFEPICQLHNEVFSQPPFHWGFEAPQQHRARLERLIASPSFGMATAIVDSVLIGFAYGHQLSVTTKWWHGFLDPVPVELTTEQEGRTFAVIDLAVRQDWRRRGTGQQLLDALLASRAEERATLATEPEALDSQAFYRRLGWKCAGRLVGVAGESAPLYDIYWRSLRDSGGGPSQREDAAR